MSEEDHGTAVPSMTQEPCGRLSDHPFTDLEDAVAEAVGWITSAADIADDLASVGVPKASEWATKWRHIVGLLDVTEGVKIASRSEQEYLDELADRADAQSY